MFGSFGTTFKQHSLAFVSGASVDHVTAKYDLCKAAVAVKNCRSIGKKDLVLNDATPKITVDPETYRVHADGVHLTCEPAKKLPLAQLYNLF
jgi:urease subunit alpha